MVLHIRVVPQGGLHDRRGDRDDLGLLRHTDGPHGVDDGPGAGHPVRGHRVPQGTGELLVQLGCGSAVGGGDRAARHIGQGRVGRARGGHRSTGQDRAHREDLQGPAQGLLHGKRFLRSQAWSAGSDAPSPGNGAATDVESAAGTAARREPCRRAAVPRNGRSGTGAERTDPEFGSAPSDVRRRRGGPGGGNGDRGGLGETGARHNPESFARATERADRSGFPLRRPAVTPRRSCPPAGSPAGDH